VEKIKMIFDNKDDKKKDKLINSPMELTNGK